MARAAGSESSQGVDWVSRLGVWIFYLVWVSLTVVLLLSWWGDEAATCHDATWPDMWQLRDRPGWTWCLYACTITIVTVFITGELTGNTSQVDKLWSLLPVLYTCLLALAKPHPRLVLMSAVSCVWGVRLTYNFYRRGGYGWPPWVGEEDYRWAHLRRWPLLNSRLGWSAFNLLFISIYQNILLLLLACPALVASLSDRPLSWADWLVAGSYLGLVLVEAWADQHQFTFQTAKWAAIKAGRTPGFPHRLGFPSDGLFSVSRHPNYLAEMTLWLTFYAFTLTAGCGPLNWSLLGSVLLALLFQGSTILMESITGKRYPAYAKYQQRVPRFIGFWNPFQSSFSSPLTSAETS